MSSPFVRFLGHVKSRFWLMLVDSLFFVTIFLFGKESHHKQLLGRAIATASPRRCALPRLHGKLDIRDSRSPSRSWVESDLIPSRFHEKIMRKCCRNIVEILQKYMIIWDNMIDCGCLKFKHSWKSVKTMRIYGFQRNLPMGETSTRKRSAKVGTLTTSSMTCITWAWPEQLMAMAQTATISKLQCIPAQTFIYFSKKLMEDPTSCNLYGLISKSRKIGWKLMKDLGFRQLSHGPQISPSKRRMLRASIASIAWDRRVRDSSWRHAMGLLV